MPKALPSARALWLLAGASALFLASSLAAVAADVVIVVLVLVDARRARLPSASRRAPRTLALGEVAEVALDVTNGASRSARVRMTDDVGAGLERAEAGVWDRYASVVVPAASTVRQVYRVQAKERGFWRLGSVHLRVLGPWGLAWRQGEVPSEDEVRVQPGIGLLRARSAHAVRRTLAETGPRRTWRKGEGREFESLRDYARGDDPRTLDWKVSAKRRQLTVRSYEADRHHSLVLAIDAGRQMRERLLDRERADFALAAALMLCARARAYGDRVGALVFDDQVRYVLPPRRANPGQLAEVLAGVRTRLVEPNYPLAMATLARTFRRRSLVVLFCDVIDDAASRPLARSLARTTRLHLPLAVAIRNPSLAAAAEAPAPSQRAAFRRAAAEELVQARTAALARMRRSGVLVVDVEPGDTLAGALEAYVEVKERGLL